MNTPQGTIRWSGALVAAGLIGTAAHGCGDETESTGWPAPTTSTTSSTTSSQGAGGSGGQPGGSGGVGATAGSGGDGAIGGSGGSGGDTGGSGGSGGDTGGSGGDTGGSGGDTGGSGGSGGAATGGSGGSGGGSTTIVATIAEVRDMADGTLTDPVTIQGAYVTYTRLLGFFIQQAQVGPGLFVFTDAQTPADLGVAVGNQIDLEVTSLATYHGLKEVDGFSVRANDDGNYDVVGNLAQDISAGAGTAPSEDTESELLLAVNMDLVSGAGTDYQAEAGSGPVSFPYYQYEGVGLGLCRGARLDTIGVGGDYDGTYALRSWYAADVTNMDTGSCTSTSTDNWDLEDWTSSDPPDGFAKTTTSELANYTMTQSTENHTVGGSYSAALTWTTANAVEILPTYQYPVTGGETYTCHAWFLDNDPAGRARLFMTWYDGGGTGTNIWKNIYTTDDPNWVELTQQETVPITAVSITCGVRLYDVAAGWDGDATVYFDDLSITHP